MKKTGVFYGSTTGTTESVANLIAEKLGIAQADVHDVSKMSADVAGVYEALILGTSTSPCSDAATRNHTAIRFATAWASFTRI